MFLLSQIDVLVNNAARSQFVKITDTPITMDKELIDVLVCGPVSLTKAVLPHFIKQKSGQVVVTSSVAGKMGKRIIITSYLIHIYIPTHTPEEN